MLKSTPSIVMFVPATIVANIFVNLCGNANEFISQFSHISEPVVLRDVSMIDLEMLKLVCSNEHGIRI
jgi:hypothetical protein